MSASAPALDRAATLIARAARWRRAGHPASRREVLRSLASGADALDALRSAGADERLVALTASVPPAAALEVFLEALACALGRAEDRRRAVRGAAVYPTLLAACAVAVAVVLAGAVRPAMSVIAGPVPLAPVILTLLASAGALAVLAAALRADTPVFPFSEAKVQHDRALVLSAAACAAAHGAPLDAALDAAAPLATSSRLSAAAAEMAASLRDAARPPDARELFGEIGQPLFVAAAARGEGPAVLDALAEAAEAVAAADLRRQTLRAELLSIAIAGSAIGIAGIALYQTYAAAIAATGGNG